MGLFKWCSSHSTYLPEIDAEHRELFRLGAELHKAILNGRDPARVKPILANLLTSAEAHFLHEERIMRAAQYPALGWHKKQHDAVRWQARRLSKRIHKGDTAARIELLTFFDAWLKKHTSVADRMMGAYLRNFLRIHTAAAS
jgi:hemerythrin